MHYDALVISAHPDDAEAQMGGTLAILSQKGQRVLLVDLTDGEPTEFAEGGVRARQADEAARILGVERRSLILQGQARGRLRYFGIPAGYEFSTLVEDLLDLSKGTTSLSEKTRTALKGVDQDLHVQVFVTPT